MLLALRGGGWGPISRKKALRNTWMAPKSKSIFFKVMPFAVADRISSQRDGTDVIVSCHGNGHVVRLVAFGADPQDMSTMIRSDL